MTVLNVIDLNKIWTVNSMWRNKFFEACAKVGATLVSKLWEKKILTKKKQKLLNIMVPNFLYINSYYLF